MAKTKHYLNGKLVRTSDTMVYRWAIVDEGRVVSCHTTRDLADKKLCSEAGHEFNRVLGFKYAKEGNRSAFKALRLEKYHSRFTVDMHMADIVKWADEGAEERILARAEQLKKRTIEALEVRA